MRAYTIAVVVVATAIAGGGCATPRQPIPTSANITAQPVRSVGSVVQAGYSGEDRSNDPRTAAPQTLPSVSTNEKTGSLSLQDLVAMTIGRNPRLAQVGWAVEAARGRAVQSGLYPNPTLTVTGDELGDRTGPGGIWTAPYFSQEIVTGDKLGLARAASLKEVDQATLTTVAERYRLFTEVRQNYFEVIVLQRRADVLGELVGLAEKSVVNANKLFKAKEGSELDIVQLEVDLERFRTELDATTKSLPAAYRRMAASVGVNDLPYSTVVGDLEIPLPEFDLDKIRAYILGVHPELRSAQIGVERANLVLRRATVEPIPNVTIGTGYVRQNQNKSSDWTLAASIPLPAWNRNQGNIHAAKAQVNEATFEVSRIENELVGRLATSFASYAAARKRAEKYKSAVVPKAEQSYQLSQKAYQGGQFEYLRVLQAQRAVAEARLEYLRSLGEAWRAASEIAGLMLEDNWPVARNPVPDVRQP